MTRPEMLNRLRSHQTEWDIIIVGGGATGVGVAIDAASRGYDTLLLEASDFGKGTSTRSTKLVHGGVRYLEQGNVSLVMEALKERGILRQNAPHLVSDLEFLVPNYDWWEAPFYGVGMKVYDLLAGKYGFGHSRLLSKEEVLGHIPALDKEGLRGGVLYYDGQFDDSRLLIDLAQTAESEGAALLNYARVIKFTRGPDGILSGLQWQDLETGSQHASAARVVINATGAFGDALRRIDDPATPPLVAPSQGVHLVLDRSFLGGNAAIMVPRTSDGRVMFAIPWHDHALLGTTDTPISEVTLEPVAMPDEIDFILETAAQYLAKRPTREDILSVFAGIRPLVKSGGGKTAGLSREHTIDVSKSGLLSIAGGKWTTYRKMAEDCVDQAATLAMLDERPCATRDLRIHAYCDQPQQFGQLGFYGSDAPEIAEIARKNPDLGRRLDQRLPIIGAQVVWAVRQEMARKVEDALARRTRALFVDARAAIAMAPQVAQIMAAELAKDAAWQEAEVRDFNAIAKNYLVETRGENQ